MLQYFATDEKARSFINSLFDAYKSMASDIQQTTTQILENTTKVRDLLRIDDGRMSPQHIQMDIDDIRTLAAHATGSIRVELNLNEEGASMIATTSGSTTTQPSNLGTSTNDSVERSTQQMTYRCHRQIAELISCLGKMYYNGNFRIRRGGQQVKRFGN